jgi:hypothetical protein
MQLRNTVITAIVLTLSGIPLVAKADSPFRLNPNKINQDAVLQIQKRTLTQPEIKAESIAFSRVNINSTRLIRVTGTVRNIGADQAANPGAHQISLSLPGLPTRYQALTNGLRRGETASVSFDLPENLFITSGEFPATFTLVYTPEPDSFIKFDTNPNNNRLDRVATAF